MHRPDLVSQFLISQLGGLPYEVFAVLFLDSRHRLIRFETLFTGSLTQTSVYPREVARRCLQLNAAAVVAAHNHPSGVAEASRADQLLTSQLQRSLALLDITLLDHLVVAGDRTISAQT
jgi:DNA repair protein RadC